MIFVDESHAQLYGGSVALPNYEPGDLLVAIGWTGAGAPSLSLPDKMFTIPSSWRWAGGTASGPGGSYIGNPDMLACAAWRLATGTETALNCYLVHIAAPTVTGPLLVSIASFRDVRAPTLLLPNYGSRDSTVGIPALPGNPSETVDVIAAYVGNKDFPDEPTADAGFTRDMYVDDLNPTYGTANPGCLIWAHGQAAGNYSPRFADVTREDSWLLALGSGAGESAYEMMA